MTQSKVELEREQVEVGVFAIFSSFNIETFLNCKNPLGFFRDRVFNGTLTCIRDTRVLS